MTPEMRRQLANLKQGDHVCPIYETSAEQIAVAIRFLQLGLVLGERCLCSMDDQTVRPVLDSLAEAGVDIARQTSLGALEVRSNRDTYLRSGEFDPYRMIDFLRQEEANALARGFSGFRFLGDMIWAMGPNPGRERLIEYETLLNEFVKNSRSVLLCQYDRYRFDGTIIHDILRCHPVAILGDMACPNPYYEPPELVLAPESGVSVEFKAKRADWWIAQLKRARAMEQQLQSSHALLQAVVEGTTDAIFVKDRESRFLMINSVGARFLGRPVDELIGKGVEEVFPPEVGIRLRKDDLRIMTEGHTEIYEEVVTGASVTRTNLTMKGPYRGPDGEILGVIGIARDITERNRIQAERDQLLAQLRLQIERLPLAYIQFDANVHVLEWNPAAERLFGYVKEEVLGRPLLDLILPEPHDEKLLELLSRIQSGALTMPNINENRTKDGRIITCEWFNTPLIADNGSLTAVISLAQDITERKLADLTLKENAIRLRALSIRLVEVQEEERRHLARELHDEVGQLLTGLRLLLKPYDDSPTTARGKGRNDQARNLVDDLLVKVRGLSFDLRPDALDQLGLLPALLAHFERYHIQTGVLVHFKHNDLERRFAPDLETTAYRIVQEALTNVARHAAVAGVTVRVWATEDLLTIQIEDQGRGFDPIVALAAPRSSGLVGMVERVELLGGHLKIESRPGAGTHITVELPVRDASREAIK